MTAAGYQAPLKKCLNVDSVVRIRHQHGVYSRKTEFLRHGLAGWITLGQAVERLGEHKSWAYYLIRKRRLLIHRDPEIGLYLVRDDERVLKELKELLRGERFSLTLERRSSGSAIVRRPGRVDRSGHRPGPPLRSPLRRPQSSRRSPQAPLLGPRRPGHLGQAAGAWRLPLPGPPRRPDRGHARRDGRHPRGHRPESRPPAEALRPAGDPTTSKRRSNLIIH